MQRLAGKSCLVTGAARGIGAAIAMAFAREGAQVIVSDIKDESGENLASAIGASYRHLDVRDETAWDQLLIDVSAIDVVVNNAGVTGFEDSAGPHDPENVSLSDWHKVHRTNLDGGLLAGSAAAPG